MEIIQNRPYLESTSIMKDMRYRLMSLEERGLYYSMKLACWTYLKLPVNFSELAKILNIEQCLIEKHISNVIKCFDVKDDFIHYAEFDLSIKKNNDTHKKRFETLGFVSVENRIRPSNSEWAIIRHRIFERDNYTCTYCGLRGGKLECDHAIPVAKGGSNADSNLVTSCKKCNRKKGINIYSCANQGE